MIAALRPEWQKVRRLPLPRALVALCLLVAVAAPVVALVSPTGSAASVVDHASLGMLLAGTLGTAIFAVWIFGLESAQGTLARTLTANPRRGQVVGAKLALATALPALVLLALTAIALPITVAATHAHGGGVSTGHVARDLLAAVVQTALIAPTVFGLAVLVRSLAGGIVAAVVLLEIVPGVFAVTGLGHVSLFAGLAALHDHVAGDHAQLGAAMALAVVGAWSATAVGAGWLRLRASDIT